MVAVTDVGEAAGALRPHAKGRIDQPCGRIVGLRNVLAHRDGALQAGTWVQIAKTALPALVAAVEADRSAAD